MRQTFGVAQKHRWWKQADVCTNKTGLNIDLTVGQCVKIKNCNYRASPKGKSFPATERRVTFCWRKMEFKNKESKKLLWDKAVSATNVGDKDQQSDYAPQRPPVPNWIGHEREPKPVLEDKDQALSTKNQIF